MGTRFIVDIEPEFLISVLQGPALTLLVHTSRLVHFLLPVVRTHKEYGNHFQTE